MKRLFLFAAFDRDGIVPLSDLHYLKALSGLGDTVFCADNDIDGEHLECLKDLVLHAVASSHGEYDFGSYKRCWNWAKDNLDLGGYDFVYLVNDSVVGPLRPLEPVLTMLEKDAAVTGMCRCPKRRGTHIQSWFVGVSKEIFTQSAFDAFLQGVRAEEDRKNIYLKYENGLTDLLNGIGGRQNILLDAPGKGIYNRPETMFKAGLPFMKKSSFTRHGGCLGRQTGRVLSSCGAFIGADGATALTESVRADLDRLHGEAYYARLTGAGVFETMSRYMKYLLGKCKK